MSLNPFLRSLAAHVKYIDGPERYINIVLVCLRIIQNILGIGATHILYLPTPVVGSKHV